MQKSNIKQQYHECSWNYFVTLSKTTVQNIGTVAANKKGSVYCFTLATLSVHGRHFNKFVLVPFSLSVNFKDSYKDR
jgi:hypothetical protein